jgi:hypothetical protein
MHESLSASTRKTPKTVKAKSGRTIEQGESTGQQLIAETKRIGKIGSEAKYNKLLSESDPKKRELLLKGLRSEMLGTVDLVSNLSMLFKQAPGAVRPEGKVLKRAVPELKKLNELVERLTALQNYSTAQANKRGRVTQNMGEKIIMQVSEGSDRISKLKQYTNEKGTMLSTAMRKMKEAAKHTQAMTMDLKSIEKSDKAYSTVLSYLNNKLNAMDPKTKKPVKTEAVPPPSPKEEKALVDIIKRIVAYKDKVSWSSLAPLLSKRVGVPATVIANLGITGKTGTMITYEGLKGAIGRNLQGDRSGDVKIGIEPSKEYFEALAFFESLPGDADELNKNLAILENVERGVDVLSTLDPKDVNQGLIDLLNETEGPDTRPVINELINQSNKVIGMIEEGKKPRKEPKRESRIPETKKEPVEVPRSREDDLYDNQPTTITNPLDPDYLSPADLDAMRAMNDPQNNPDKQMTQEEIDAVNNPTGTGKSLEASGPYSKGKAIRHALKTMGVGDHEMKVVLTKTGLFKKACVKDKYDKLPLDSKDLIEALYKYERTYPNRKLTIKLLNQQGVFDV